LKLLASARSAGKRMKFRGEDVVVEELTHDSFKNVDIALFSAGGGISKEFAPSAAAAGAVVIDNSSAFRMDADVPLVVPEINPQAAKNHPRNIIANPNCTTIPLTVAVAPLHRAFGLERIWLASYQSVSGAGRDAVDQLQYETEFVALRRAPDTNDSPLPAQIADNIIPHIDEFDEHGHTGEETKTMRESAKILGIADLKVTSTCVRVPVSVGHSLAITCRFAAAVKPKDALKVLKDAPGVVLYDRDRYVTPALARGNDNVYVCRVREGADPHEISLWVVTDNLRKGAATNAVQIAELLFR
jgi:aspartate-semialdehyde dehydrogenase